MTDDTTLVLNGFFSLSPEEQQDLVDTINEYYKNGGIGKRQLREGIEKHANRIVLGPLGGGCPCCHK